MAIKAGRVGVRNDQVDVYGKIKDNSTPYVLPTASADTLGGVKVGNGLAINEGVLSNSNPTPYSLPVASASSLGGVKAVTKTEAMTKEVGIDADGKLYVEPSSGGGAVTLGSATLKQLTGTTGYCDYAVQDGICYFFGKLTAGSIGLNAYSQVAIFEDMPTPVQNMQVSAVVTIDKYNYGNNTGNANMGIGTDGLLYLVARATPLNNESVSFSGMYPVGDDFTQETVTLIGCSNDSIMYALYNDRYCFLYGNVNATSWSDSTSYDFTIVQNLSPAFKQWKNNFVLGDNCKFYNALGIDVINGDLHMNRKGIAGDLYRHIDFCSCYYVDDEEES